MGVKEGSGGGGGGWAGCGAYTCSYFERLRVSGPAVGEGITLTPALSPQGRGGRTPGPAPRDGFTPWRICDLRRNDG